jgi:hypothetical protein
MSATERFQLLALAVAFLCVGSAMASFDVVRARAGRPIAGGRDVLAIISAVAAIVR